MTDETLKPCGHCGADATLHAEESDNWQIHCDECPAMMIVLPTQQEAIAAWNRRV